MSRMIRFNVISSLLVLITVFVLMLGVICCTKKTSAANINQPAVTVDQTPEKITLNGEANGTTADTSVLVKKLKNVFKNREDEGVFRKNSNEVEKEILISGSDSLSAENFMKIYSAVKEAGAAPIKIPVKSNIDPNSAPKPNPLTLVVFAGQEKSTNERFYDLPQNGIEVSFVGQMLHTEGEPAFDKTEILIIVGKDGNYLIDGRKIPRNTLETEIKNRLKNKTQNNRKIFAQIEDTTQYGLLADIATAAANADCAKVYFITPNKTVTEQDITFSLPPTWLKDDKANKQNVASYEGSDETLFIITIGGKLDDEDHPYEIRAE